MQLPLTNRAINLALQMDVIRDQVDNIVDKFWEIVPGILFFIIFIIVGYVVGKIAAVVFRKFLEKVKFEKTMDKVKVSKHFKSIGFKGVGHFLSIFVFWFIFLIFLQVGLGAIKIQIITDILSPIILFIPRALIAALLVVIGLYVGTLVANLVEKALNKSGLKKSTRKIDEQLKGTKYSLFSILGIIIKVWILLLFVQAALDVLAIEALTQFVTPIILYFPRVVAAFFVVLIGLVIADYITEKIKNWLERTPMGKRISKADKKTATEGFSIMGIILILIKVWILLLFVQIALDILAIPILTRVIEPILLYFPRILVAMAVIIIGLLVTDIILKFVHKLLDEFEADKFIEPVEDIISKPGLVMKFVDALIKITVMLIFIDIAVAILDIAVIANLVSEVVLWIPNLFAAALIVILGLWVAGWVSDKTLSMSKENKLPFPRLVSNAVRFLIIYIVITMALAQLGIEVPILYLVFGIAFGAVMIGLGAGFAFGLKDVMTNMGGYLQVNEIVKPGKQIEVGEYSGKVKEITRYNTIIEDETGDEKAIPNNYLVENTVTIKS
ncbi:MAG: mechanosensitive ion channel family protein [Thermoplasmata archaeon]